jgi:hypothetical protein
MFDILPDSWKTIGKQTDEKMRVFVILVEILISGEYPNAMIFFIQF